MVNWFSHRSSMRGIYFDTTAVAVSAQMGTHGGMTVDEAHYTRVWVYENGSSPPPVAPSMSVSRRKSSLCDLALRLFRRGSRESISSTLRDFIGQNIDGATPPPPYPCNTVSVYISKLNIGN